MPQIPDSYRLQNILGWNVIINNQLCTTPKTIPRTWKERLFSFPWHPLVKNKVIQIPSTDVIMLSEQKTLCMHGTLYAMLCVEIEKDRKNKYESNVIDLFSRIKQ